MIASPLRIGLALLLVTGFPPASFAQEPAHTLAPLARVLAESSDPLLQRDILRGMQAALQGRRSFPMPDGWEPVEERLAQSRHPDVRTATEALSLIFGSRRALESLRATLANPSLDPAGRSAALESLLAARDAQLPPVLQSLLGTPPLRAPALRGLASFDDPKTPESILAVYPDLPPAERRDALNTLASRARFAAPLLEAVDNGIVPRNELTADIIRQLRNLRDDGVQQQITRVWGVFQEPNPDMTREIQRFKRLYQAGGSQPGDASRGRVVYDQVCAQCHHLFDSGGKVGPDITGANRSDLDYLLENILFPNAVIPNEYLQSAIETTDDRVLTGIVLSRNASTVVIQTANEQLTLPLSEVRSIEQAETSMMPEGLLAQLADQEIRDLLYYLTRPGQVPLPEP